MPASCPRCAVSRAERAAPWPDDRRARSEERWSLGRRLNTTCGRHAGLIEQTPEDHRAARGKVIPVVVEQCVDLVGLTGEARERRRPTRRAPPAEYIQSKRCHDFSERMFHVFTLRPWKRTYATACVASAMRRRRRSTRACAARRPTRTRGRSARGTRTCPPARPPRARSGAGTRRAGRAGRGGRARPRAPPSPRPTSRICGWYWSRIPRSFPESSSGSSDARNAANAAACSAGS